MRRHIKTAHMVVQEEKAAVSAGACGNAHRTCVRSAGRKNRRSVHRHGREFRAKIVQEIIEELQLAIGGPFAAELAERRHEVVVLDREVGSDSQCSSIR